MSYLSTSVFEAVKPLLVANLDGSTLIVLFNSF